MLFALSNLNQLLGIAHVGFDDLVCASVEFARKQLHLRRNATVNQQRGHRTALTTTNTLPA